MPKLFKSKMFLFTLFVVVVGFVYSIKEQIRIRELRQYVQWKPRPVIKDYEFIHNGKALVIEWDDGDERKLIEEVNNGKPQFAYQLNTPNGASGEKATLFYTKFIKCFLLRADSLSDWGLVVKTAVNAMMIPPVNVVLCFKG